MSTFAASITQEASIEDLSELATVLKAGLGARVKDRTHRLRSYKRCFPGSAGVAWLVANGHAADADGAVALGNAMLQAGLLHHVAYEHTFKDSELLYKFTADDEAGPVRELAGGHLSGVASADGSATPVVPGTPTAAHAHAQGGLHTMASEPFRGSTRGRASTGSGNAQAQAHPHAHRALINAQIHGLNARLERLAGQHAALAAASAQQQEAFDGQAAADVREVREAVAQLAAALAPTQRQVLQIATQVAQLQAQMSSQRALVGTQHAIMAIAILAMGTGWAAPALWGLAAAAVGGLAAVLLGWGAEDSAAERSSAALELLGAQRRASQQRAASLAAGAGAGAGGSGGSSPRLPPVNVPGGKGDGRGALRVLAAASEGSSASDAPAPATAAVEALQCGRVIRGKSIDSLAPKLEEFDSWPDGDLLLRPSPRAPDVAVTRVQRYQPHGHATRRTERHDGWEAAQRRWRAVAAEADEDDTAAAADQGADGGSWVPAPGAGVPINQYIVHVESDLFVGKMLLYVRGLPSSYEPYFAGKKRRSVLMFQGRFKRPVGVNDLVTGMEYDRPYKNLRGCWIMEKVVLAFAKRVVSAMETGDMASEPFITFHLLPLAHVVNVSLPGEEPPIDQAPEDLRLWDPTLSTRSGEPMPSESRRRHFMAERNRRARTFSTEHVWTFCIWQQVIDYAGYYLDLLVQNYDVIQHMDGQPLQAMMKDKASGKYLFNFLYWNKKLLEGTAKQRALEEEEAARKL